MNIIEKIGHIMQKDYGVQNIMKQNHQLYVQVVQIMVEDHLKEIMNHNYIYLQMNQKISFLINYYNI